MNDLNVKTKNSLQKAFILSLSSLFLPVILDDIFGMYEEEDLEAVLGWMYKEKKQVIISTCNKREMELLDRDGIPYGKQIIS